jgi:PPK2 family polyphosphate:nucleotide phosphotransferase
MGQPVKITERIRLKDFNPSFHDGLAEAEAAKATAKLCERIGETQKRLHANANHALLLIFQGMDASGKDGASRRVLSEVNPCGVETANFKRPNDEELAHDFLWRVHRAAPRLGYIGVFNRSHYEDVLAVRVLGLQPKSVWKKRFAQINDFERMLAENRVIILKFFLHISREEQGERLRQRLKDPSKNWKFSPDDLKARALWDQYQEAYEDAINQCNAKHARWRIVPSNNKWYRDLVVAQTVAEALDSLHMGWPKSLMDLTKVRVR